MASRLATLSLLLLAITAPWLYDRYQTVNTLFIANRPGNWNPLNTFESVQVKFSDKIRNCEDVLIADEKKGVAILSCDAGRDGWNTVMGTFKPRNDTTGSLWLYSYTSTSPSPMQPILLKNFPNAATFHPLGISYDSSTSTLYAINHAPSSSVLEIFSLSLHTATATHIRTFSHPLLHAPNALHSLGNGKFYTTNDHYFPARLSPLLSKIETYSGAPGGSVVYIDTEISSPSPSPTAKIVARLPFANGVARLNSTTLVVASSSKPGIYFYSITPDFGLIPKGYIRVNAAVDNLSVDGNGVLLMAGHLYPPALTRVAAARASCDVDGGDEVERCACDSPSWVAEWTEEGGVRELYRGNHIGGSSTAVRDVGKGVGIVSGLYDKGVMVFT